MFFKLAVRNVKRQFGNYLIYFMTVALTVALLFAIKWCDLQRKKCSFIQVLMKQSAI